MEIILHLFSVRLWFTGESFTTQLINSFPLGQISASLAAMHRTIDDYDSMAKREMIKAKQEKAQMRVQKFRSDYTEFRNQFERLKFEVTAEVHMELAIPTLLTNISDPFIRKKLLKEPN